MNYEQLLNGVLYPQQPGIARCRTPIKRARLEGLIKWINDQGWDGDYRVTIGPDGLEWVYVYWDPAKQHPGRDGNPSLPAGIIYNETSRKRPPEGDSGPH